MKSNDNWFFPIMDCNLTPFYDHYLDDDEFDAKTNTVILSKLSAKFLNTYRLKNQHLPIVIYH